MIEVAVGRVLPGQRDLLPDHLDAQLRDGSGRLEVVDLAVGRGADDGGLRAVERLVEREEPERVGGAVREAARRAGRRRPDDRGAHAQAVGVAARRLRALLGDEHVAGDVVVGPGRCPGQVDAAVARRRGQALRRRGRRLIARGDRLRDARHGRVARAVDGEHGVAVELAVERVRVAAGGHRRLAGRVAVGDRRGRDRGRGAAHDVAGDPRARPVSGRRPGQAHRAVDRCARGHAAGPGGRRGVIDHAGCARGRALEGHRVPGDRDDHVGVAVVEEARGRVRVAS